jgi:hypothetical protein
MSKTCARLPITCRKPRDNRTLAGRFRTGESLPGLSKLERVRTMFFSAHTPESWVARYVERLQTEQSGKAAFDMVFGSRHDARFWMGRRCPANPHLALHRRPLAFGGYTYSASHPRTASRDRNSARRLGALNSAG